MATIAAVQTMPYCPMCAAMGGWGMLLMGVLWIALLAVVVWGVARLVRRGRHDSGLTAEEILRQRYARGEIDHQAYEKMRRDLSA